ncbi:hypothetical protein KAR91_80145 [Candidatus Pacearchaeota archaeon]|nr:hypothetical protein [Candidatus Pacearchaeota archaeon]
MLENWAKSLHNPVHNKNEESCGWSDEFGVTIHRFDSNTTICRCGAVKASRQEYKGGWKKQKHDSSK